MVAALHVTKKATTCFDIEDTPALLDYLRAHRLIARGEETQVRSLDGGVSNRVVLVTPARSQAFVVKQALEKLRVQVDWFCTPRRIEHEAAALKHLSVLAPEGAVPALLFQDAESHLLVMESVLEPHQNWKQMLLAGMIVTHHVEQFGVLLGSLHRESAQKSEQMMKWFGDWEVFEALRLEPYYRYTASQIPQSASFLHQLIEDTLARRLTVVHGDYSPKNILVRADRLVLLDYEVVHFGDPAFDLGFSMAHFLGKAHHVRSHREKFMRAAIRYWRSYKECVGEPARTAGLEERAARHTIGCCLARVAGRSPLEYLTADERATQTRVMMEMLKKAPATMEGCLNEFAARIAWRSSNV